MAENHFIPSNLPHRDILQVLGDLQEPVACLDWDWRLIYFNRSAARVSRLRPEHLNGPTHWEIFPDTLGTEVEQVYTQERRDQQALRLQQQEAERQRAEIETVYRTAPVGLALFDPVEFRYLRLNDRQAEFFGLRPEDVLGRTLTEMAPFEGLRRRGVRITVADTGHGMSPATRARAFEPFYTTQELNGAGLGL